MNSKKPLKIVLSVLLALILLVAIFFIAAPRTAMKLVMSDVNYAKYVVSKNALKAYNKNDALKFTGRLSGSIGEVELLDDDESVGAVNNYLKNIFIDVKIHKGKEAARLYMTLSDADGGLLTGEAIFSEDLNCFKINELKKGWLKLDKQTVKASTAAATANTSVPGVEIDKLIKVSKDKIEITATTTQLKNGIASDFLPDEYKELFDGAIRSIVPKLSSFGFENIDIEFSVNGRNKITDMTVLLTGAEKEASLEIAFDKVSEGSFTYNDLVLSFEIEETKFQSFDIPSKMEVTSIDEATLKADLIECLLSETLADHPDLTEVYSAIFGSKIKSGIGALLEGFLDTDALADGITGIIDSAMNRDSGQVDEIVSKFFEAFGIVE